MIRHVFAWQVAEGHDGDQVVQLLTDFSKEVDVIRYWEIGQHEGAPNENGDPWDGALITDFEEWKDLDTYSNHPAHVTLIDKLLPMVKARAVIDFTRSER